MADRNLTTLIREALDGKLTRREFIGRALALGVSLSALGPLLTAQAQDAVTIQWWDHFGPLELFHTGLFDAYTQEHPNERVEHTLYAGGEMGQALQLAFRSGQAPDVHSLAGLEVPPSQLVKEGWFQPLPDDFDTSNPFIAAGLFEGLNVFDGVPYTFPIFSFRRYAAALWYHKSMIEAAGFDPEVGPRTWNEVHEAAKATTQGRTFGLIYPLQGTAQVGFKMEELAEVAGAQSDVDWHTGEYIIGSEPYVQATNFFLQFQKDKSLHPASTSLQEREARARWLAGEAAMFFDGPWNSGAMAKSYPEIADEIGCALLPLPDGAPPAYVHRPPESGNFWINSQSQHPEVAGDFLQLLTTPEYYVALAERMDQPPIDPTAVEQASVTENYRKLIADFGERVRLEPSPIVRNANVALVYAEMRPISPNPGEIVQGLFSGALNDPAAALTEFRDKLTAERARAIEVVQGQGAEVSLDDFIFENWDPSEDYTADKYNE